MTIEQSFFPPLYLLLFDILLLFSFPFPSLPPFIGRYRRPHLGQMTDTWFTLLFALEDPRNSRNIERQGMAERLFRVANVKFISKGEEEGLSPLVFIYSKGGNSPGRET